MGAPSGAAVRVVGGVWAEARRPSLSDMGRMVSILQSWPGVKRKHEVTPGIGAGVVVTRRASGPLRGDRPLVDST
jgi:hypothetical protein